MILVDSSIWIDHLHTSEPALVELLSLDQVGCHSLIIQEIALGSIRQRDVVVMLLTNLYQFPAVGHRDILYLTEQRQLWGRGLSAIDVHLLAAATVEPGTQLWTRDKRLKAACAETGVVLFSEQ